MKPAVYASMTILGVHALLSPHVVLASAEQPEQRPNIIIILTDDLGYGDLACVGAADMRTPRIDRLFASGMRFRNFYANSSVCSPSRAALLTGRYPDLVGVPGVIRTHPEENWGYLSPQAVLLPKLLKDAGYRTAIVGKWHLGLESPNLPNERGFELFHGFLGDMMDDYYTHLRHGINYLRLDGQPVRSDQHATDMFTDWACAFLRQQTKDRPFFLYLAYNAPHVPIQPPAAWLKRVMERQPGADPKRAKMVALIEHLDDSIGKVLDVLHDTGADRQTLIVFTSDNGGAVEFGSSVGSLRGTKGGMYEGGLKVPMAACWPGHIHAGGNSEGIGLLMDLFPTVLEAAGVAVPPGIDGVSLLPTLLGREHPPEERTLFFMRREGWAAYGGKEIDAVRRGRWKLLQNSPYAPRELYDLESDPHEDHNLVNGEKKMVRELSTALERHLQRAGAVPWERP